MALPLVRCDRLRLFRYFEGLSWSYQNNFASRSKYSSFWLWEQQYWSQYWKYCVTVVQGESEKLISKSFQNLQHPQVPLVFISALHCTWLNLCRLHEVLVRRIWFCYLVVSFFSSQIPWAKCEWFSDTWKLKLSPLKIRRVNQLPSWSFVSWRAATLR